MDDMVSPFYSQFAITKEESQVIVIDKQEELLLWSSRVFLVGLVPFQKLINKENFKRQMRSLWRPKANVLIVELEGDLFAFGFNTKHVKTMIHMGGPWLYNKQALILLAEADDITHPTRIPLMYQELWVQIKRLPLCYMTQNMVFWRTKVGKMNNLEVYYKFERVLMWPNHFEETWHYNWRDK